MKSLGRWGLYRRNILLTSLLLVQRSTPTCFAFGFHSLHNHQCSYRQAGRSQLPTSKSELSVSYEDITTVHNGEDTERVQVIEEETSTIQQHNPQLLSLTLQELSDELKGSGRAAVVWDCIRSGIDPNLYYNGQGMNDSSDDTIANKWLAATSSSATPQTDGCIISDMRQDEHSILGRREGQGLGISSFKKLQNLMHNYHHSNVNNVHQSSQQTAADRDESIYTIENSIASVSHIKVSADGTTKLLLNMKKDDLEVESVIIPWMDKGFSTLCVSSQVGCRQGCTFCATGRMGKLRSLTADEILVQVYYASKVCRVVGSNDDGVARILPKIDNIVFMGMGEPADNAKEVVKVANTLADRRMFGLAQSKVTISTVGPDPSAFLTLGKAPAALAWSVHAVDDTLRRTVVPTTKHTMEELRSGLVTALSSRSNKLRRTMLEVALIDDVNDSDKDARLLAEFAQSIMNDVAGSKVVVNLIPYNAIDHPTYRTPSMDSVLRFQKIVTDGGVLCYVRTTRGDEESAACGQLATKRKRKVNG